MDYLYKTTSTLNMDNELDEEDESDDGLPDDVVDDDDEKELKGDDEGIEGEE